MEELPRQQQPNKDTENAYRNFYMMQQQMNQEQKPQSQNFERQNTGSSTQERDHPQRQEQEQPNKDVRASQVLEFDFSGNAVSNEPENFDEKPIKPVGGNDFYNPYEAEDRKQPAPKTQGSGKKKTPKKPKNQPIPHDEKPIGGGRPTGVDDMPIKTKASNFEELLEKELQKNPEAALGGQDYQAPKVPKKKEFLKRKKPVTAPPKNNKPTKYKYYAENFNEDPFPDPDSSTKTANKTQKQTPFGNVAERIASQDQEKPKEETKPKPKKNFLVRGGGIGGGVGQLGQQKKEEVKTKAKPKEAPSAKSNRTQSNKTQPKAAPAPRRGGRAQKKIFDSDSEDEERDESSDRQESDHSDNVDVNPPSPSEIIQKSQSSSSEKSEKSPERVQETAPRPPSQTDDQELVDLGVKVERTEIPAELLENIPQKAREHIEDKLYELDTEIARHEKIVKQDIKTKQGLQASLVELQKDNEEFAAVRGKEIQELKDYQDTELKKIRKERKEFEKSQKIKKGAGNNKGKQEIDELKAKIQEMHAEIRAKDKKSNANIEKLKTELEFYTSENDNIQREIRQVERERIQRLNSTKETKPVVKKKTQVKVQENPTPSYTVTRHGDMDEPEVDSDNEPEPIMEEFDEEGSDDEAYLMTFPEKYHNQSEENSVPISESVGNNNKINRYYQNGKKEIIFNNGVKKQIFPDGYTIVYFNNRDVKQTFPDAKGVYYFSEAETTQTTYPDGLKVFRFGNGQIEKHYPDQTKEIR